MSQTTLIFRLAALETTSFNMVISLRRVDLRTQLSSSSSWTSPSPFQLHPSILKVGFVFNSLWTSALARFFSADHTEPKLSGNLVKAQYRDEALKRARARAILARKHKLTTDPEYLRRFREQQRAWRNSNLESLHHPKYLERRKLEAKRLQERIQIDPAFALVRRSPTWITRHQWVRENLPWKTHYPVCYPEKVEHDCTKCLISRYGGAKLWWKKRIDPGQDDRESYQCHRCYFTGFDKLPEGYEDIPRVSIKALRARKIELDGPDSIPDFRGRPRKPTTTKPT